MMDDERLKKLGMLADFLELLADDEENGETAMIWSGIFRKIDKVRCDLEQVDYELKKLYKKQEGLE